VSVVANVALNLDTRGVPQKLREVQNQAQQTERAFDSIGNSVGKLVRAYAAFQAVKFVFAQTAEIETQTRSLQVLTGSVEKATQIVKQLQDLGAVTPFTSSELIDAAKRLQAFGVESNKVVDTTRRLADVSGATGAELQGLVTAYGQVQAKGRLQGEELLQFQERGVALQKVLRDEYKLSGSEFQKALEKGQISAQAVEYAIQKLTDAGGKYANGAIAQSDTLNGKLSTLQDSFQRLAQNIGKFFEPVFKFLIDGVNALIERLNNASKIGAEARAYQEANRRTQSRFGARAANPFDQEVQQYRERLRKSLVIAEMGGTGIPAAPKGSATLPALLAPSGGKGGADKAAREAKRLQEELRRSVQQGDQMGTQFSRMILQLSTTSDIERKRLDIQAEYEDRAKQISELKNEEQRINLTTLNSEIRRLELIRLQNDELKKQIDEFYNRAGFTPQMLGAGQGEFRTDINLQAPSKVALQIEAYKKQLQEIVAVENQVKMGAESVGTAFGQAFQGLVAGTVTAQQAFAEMMQSIADHFLQMATQIITQQITMMIYGTILKALGVGGGTSGFSFQGAGPVSGASVFGSGQAGFNPAAFSGGFLGRATGGPVTANAPYMVGERGPELFVPSTNGGVMSNSDLRSAMGAAPGSAGSSPVLNMSFETTNIGGVEYVSRDQLEAAMAATRRQAASDGAKRGMNMTLDRLQQSPRTRSRVGLG